MTNNEAENRGEELDQDLQSLKKETAEMTPEQQLELGLAENVEPEEMADVAGQEERELSDRSNLLAETLKTLQSGDQISDDQKAELMAKLIGEFSKLREQSEKAGEKKEIYKKAGLGVKDIAIGSLAVLTTGTVGEMFLGWDARRAKKGKKSVFGQESHQTIAKVQKWTRRAVITAFCPEGLPFLYGAEKLREVVDGTNEENDKRVKEGKEPLTLKEKLGKYAEAVPKDFFEDPKNIELIGAVVGSIGKGVGGDTGKNIENIGTQIGEKPEMARTVLKNVMSLTREGKLDLNQEDVLRLAQVAMKERQRRKEAVEGVEITDEMVETMSLEELERDKTGLITKLDGVVRKYDEINSRLAQYDREIAKNDQVIAQLDQSRKELSNKLAIEQEDQKAMKKAVGWSSRKDVYEGDIANLQAGMKELDNQRIQLEQAKLGLILEKDNLEDERTISDGKKEFLYEQIGVIDSNIAVERNKGRQEQPEVAEDTEPEEEKNGADAINISEAKKKRKKPIRQAGQRQRVVKKAA